MTTSYESPGPSREEIDATTGPLVLEFGTNWCGYCQNAASHVSLALSEHAPFPYLKIEDGPGRRLGRSFRVKLWPTLIFLRDGVEKARVVRPHGSQPIREALQQILAP